MHYYNEFDPQAAAWLQVLIDQHLIPEGVVDTRSIVEVTAEDLGGFVQCHFFAGIGGWPLALQLAGVPSSTRLWTGSCPCQPFSVAGEGKGTEDERHLWPVFFKLIRECHPERVFGEQVANAIGKGWLDGVSADLESEDYACGATVLGAHSVGAPHMRQRLYWVADDGRRGREVEVFNSGDRPTTARCRETGQLGNAGMFGCLADTSGQRRQQDSGSSSSNEEAYGRAGRIRSEPKGNHKFAGHGKDGSYWGGYELLDFLDGKQRRVEPGTFPLAYGFPCRVDLLRGYGNAIVPQVAAEFVKAFYEVIES